MNFHKTRIFNFTIVIIIGAFILLLLTSETLLSDALQEQVEPSSELTIQELLEEEYEKYGALIMIVLAFIAMFGMVFVMKSQQALKSQVKIIKEQKNEIARKSDELAFQNESLEALNFDKNSMISVVAHDLKTPLGNVQGLTGLLLLEKETLSPDQLKYLDLINKVVADGITMVNNTLDIHKIESEQYDISLINQDIVAIAEKVIKMNNSLALAKKIKVNLNAPPDGLTAKTDAQYLSQIMSNVVSNAIKYSPELSHVDVDLNDKDTVFEIIVKDHGQGISEVDKKRLFAGYRKKPVESSSAGIGLIIVRRLIEKLNGKITVDTTEGEGSTFVIEFLK